VWDERQRGEEGGSGGGGGGGGGIEGEIGGGGYLGVLINNWRDLEAFRIQSAEDEKEKKRPKLWRIHQ
jgi:hypothetical protein